MIRRLVLLLCCAATALAAAAAGPREVVRAFLEAIFTGAPARAQALCVGDGLRDEIAGLSAYVTAGRRVEAGLVRRFGESAREALGVEADLRRAFAELDAAPLAQEGATTTVPLSGVLAADALVLRLEGARWKIVAGSPPEPALATHHRAAARSLPEAADAVLAGLEAGAYATAREAVQDFHARRAALEGATDPAAEPRRP